MKPAWVRPLPSPTLAETLTTSKYLISAAYDKHNPFSKVAARFFHKPPRRKKRNKSNANA